MEQREKDQYGQILSEKYNEQIKNGIINGKWNDAEIDGYYTTDFTFNDDGKEFNVHAYFKHEPMCYPGSELTPSTQYQPAEYRDDETWDAFSDIEVSVIVKEGDDEPIELDDNEVLVDDFTNPEGYPVDWSEVEREIDRSEFEDYD